MPMKKKSSLRYLARNRGCQSVVAYSIVGKGLFYVVSSIVGPFRIEIQHIVAPDCHFKIIDLFSHVYARVLF